MVHKSFVSLSVFHICAHIYTPWVCVNLVLSVLMGGARIHGPIYLVTNACIIKL